MGDENMSLVSRVQQIAIQHPEKVAYHFMGKDTTYAEFQQAVKQFANALQLLGIEKGDNVGFLLSNSPHFLISLYATMHIGATAVPINPIYTPDEITYIVKNSDAKAIIALDALLPLVEKAVDIFTTVENYIICETQPNTGEKLAALPDSLKVKVKSFTSLISNSSPSALPVEVLEDDNAVILYTSGTTGQPKGAMLTYKNIYSNARDVAEYLSRC